ncbi:MAG: hypothetical protein V4549_19170 [Bacteroidota bacterium]
MSKAELDYFAPFLSLWLACNSWYRSHYSELTARNNPRKSPTDRDFIDKIKSDTSGRNHLYTAFKKKIDSNDRNFKTNLELLHKALNRLSIKPDKIIYQISFNKLLIDYEKKDQDLGYINIIRSPKIKKNGDVGLTDQASVVKLDQIYITSDLSVVFGGVFELIYQIRNQLVHGHLNPEKDEHEMVKYCYMILNDLMRG